ncbi:MAG: hypothetical protein EB084_15085 [Proteobacteria bacterium]|nr:hypothetical protein [Pseudomonadota bacterium]
MRTTPTLTLIVLNALAAGALLHGRGAPPPATAVPPVASSAAPSLPPRAAGIPPPPSSARPNTATVGSTAYVDADVQRYALTAAETNFTRVGWQIGLDHAQKVAQEKKRPLFIFSMHGTFDSRC